jgi:hypothetical protein
MLLLTLKIDADIVIVGDRQKVVAGLDQSFYPRRYFVLKWGDDLVEFGMRLCRLNVVGKLDEQRLEL